MSQATFAASTTPSLTNLDANFTELYGKTAWATTGIGYATGAGGAVTQATSKSTTVTLNKVCGQITTSTAALAAATKVFFAVNNSTVAATDVVHVSVGTVVSSDLYRVWCGYTAAGVFGIGLENVSAGSRSEAVLINFTVIKAVTS